MKPLHHQLKGYRTLIAVLAAVGALVLGLKLVGEAHRHEVYMAFAGALVGVVGVIGTRSGVEALAGGGGVAGAWKALTSSQKPEPPAPPATP